MSSGAQRLEETFYFQIHGVERSPDEGFSDFVMRPLKVLLQVQVHCNHYEFIEFSTSSSAH